MFDISNKKTHQTTFFAFWLVTMLGLLSNYAYVFYAGFNITLILEISALTAGISTLVILPLCLIPAKWFARLYICMTTAVLSTILITEYFILINFSKVINSDIIDILFSSNKYEAQQFLTTYLPITAIPIYLVALCAIIVCCTYMAKIISSKKWVNVAGLISGAFGLCILGYSAYGFAFYRNGYSIPQLTSLTRSVYSVYTLNVRVKQIDNIFDACHNYIINNSRESENKEMTVCLIIGESHSVFHTDAYGYEKITFPYLHKIAENNIDGSGCLVWYHDAVSVSDHTHTVMESIFSMSRHETFESSTLFPAHFKALGYTTTLYDNQYFVNKGVSFLNDRKLSDLLFDYRNTHSVNYEELTPPIAGGNRLLIYHLMGSHYVYSSRYPHDRFTVFTSSDYKYPESEAYRDIISHYDNSLVYTDYILFSIINRLKESKAVVVYVSDHGEEIYEQDDFIGHGNAAMRPQIDYQLRVPMFVWMSNSYMEAFPDTAKNVASRSGAPCISDDIGHLLIELTNEHVAFDKTRSVINDEYITPRRIVLHSIDFDSCNHLE